MVRLFQKKDGSPMPFHLTNLPDMLLVKFTNMIELNGGKVESNPGEDVFTFTVPMSASDHELVYDVKFIEDCVKSRKIVNIEEYSLGSGDVNCCGSNQRAGELSLQESTKNNSLSKAVSPESSTTETDCTTVINVDEDSIEEILSENDMDFERHSSDSSDSSEPEKITCINEMVIDSELREWIEALNKNRSKDADGYPKKLCRSYTPWESQNLLKFLIKTKTYHQAHHEIFWRNVERLKLLPKSRNYRSAYKHFNFQIMPNIEQYHLPPNLEAELMVLRDEHKAARRKKLDIRDKNQIRI